VSDHGAKSWRPDRLGIAVLFVACGAVLYCGYIAVFWQPILSEVRHGHSMQGSIKASYLGDQLTYLAIARNVQEGRPAYVEPFTATGSSIYPSGYYWLLGRFASATGTNPFFAWNVVGIGVALALAAAAGAWARWATRETIGWMFGPLPLLIGTLTWMQNGSWVKSYGEQAVLWPGYIILFNPGAEVPGMVLTVAAALCLAKGLSPIKDDMRWLAAAGAAVGTTVQVHTFTALFAGTVAVFTLLAYCMLEGLSQRALLVVVASVVGSWAVVLSGLIESPLVLLVVLLAGAVIPLFVAREWHRHRAGVLAFGGGAVVAALSMIVRIGADVRRPDSFFSYRQELLTDIDMSLPLGDVVLAMAPVLALACVALAQLVTGRRRDQYRAWAACIIGTLVGSALLLCNAAWGMNQEPYRFYPYSQLLLAVLCLPWLYRAAYARRQLLVRTVVGVGLLATIPATLLWGEHHTDLRLRFTAGERRAFSTVAASLPRHGVALVDTCIPRRAFKVLTSANVVDYHARLAIPRLQAELARVLAHQRNGILPSGAELRAAEVTSFVTLNYCRTVDRPTLVQRFGQPIVRVQPVNAAACGMPPDTAYEVYRTTDDDSPDNGTKVPGFDVGAPHAFRPDPAGNVPTPSDDCAYGFVSPLPYVS
jgi:hypothetical protein